MQSRTGNMQRHSPDLVTGVLWTLMRGDIAPTILGHLKLAPQFSYMTRYMYLLNEPVKQGTLSHNTAGTPPCSSR